MKRDLILTFASEALVLLCGLLVYRLAKQNLGGEGFAVYALCRRTHSLLAPALLIGCTVAIPRFIAYNKVHDVGKSDSYFKAGMMLIGISTLFFVALMNVISEQAAGLLFGEPNLANLTFPLSIMMVGYILHSLCYSYFRGHSRMVLVNMLQIFNIALIPLVAMSTARSTVAVLTWTGIAWVISGGIVLIFVILPKLTGRLSVVHWKEMFSFGVQRIPADFGAAALFGLPATLTAHTSGVIAAGQVAFSISLLNMCGAVFAPIGLVLLPKASAALARKDYEIIKRYLRWILIGSTVVSFGLMIVFEVAAAFILNLYLGGSVEKSLILVSRITILAAVPYGIYVASRSMIDAFFIKSVNSMNIFIALTFFLILTFGTQIISLTFFTPLVSLVISLYLLGIATLVACSRIIPIFSPEVKG